jgi:hypothetical protein
MSSQSTVLYVDALDLMLKKAGASYRNKLCFRSTAAINTTKIHLLGRYVLAVCDLILIYFLTVGQVSG